MEFITVSQCAELHNLSERTVRNWCSAGKMDGTFLSGKTWIADTPLPPKGKRSVAPLLKRLREEKAREREWGHGNAYLTDTCLTAQDNYKALLDCFKIKY